MVELLLIGMALGAVVSGLVLLAALFERPARQDAPDPAWT